MKRIWLPKYRRYVLVDTQDAAFARGFTLGLSGGSGNCDYVYAYKKGMGDAVPLHRLIAQRAGIDVSHDVDHRNRRKLDCRRRNLRPATRSQNFANRPKHRSNKSGFKGVLFHKQSGRWWARIGKDYRQISLGLHDTPQGAHRAYVRAARELYGEFASP